MPSSPIWHAASSICAGVAVEALAEADAVARLRRRRARAAARGATAAAPCAGRGRRGTAGRRRSSRWPRSRALSIAFCSALKSGTPASFMTTISPSSQADVDAERLDRRGERLHLVGPVVAAAGDQPRLAARRCAPSAGSRRTWSRRSSRRRRRRRRQRRELRLEPAPAAAPSAASTRSGSGGRGRRRRAARRTCRAARAPRPGPSGLATTLSGSAAMTSYSASGRAHSSRFLNSIHWSCLSPGLAMRTSSHRPASFSPCRRKTSLPLAMPSRGSPTGSQVPRSQTMTVPAPYCFGGIVPSKPRVVERMVLDVDRHPLLRPGRSYGPFGTAQLSSTPSSSSRKS